MAVDYKDVEPQIKFGPNREKIVQIGSLQLDGMNAITEAIAKADLPLPTITADGIAAFVEKTKQEFQRAVGALDASIDNDLATIRASAQISALNATTMSAIFIAAVDLIGNNLPTFYQWFLKHPPILEAMLTATTNLTREDARALRAVDVVIVARRAWERIVADGFFEEVEALFAGLIGVKSMRATGANIEEQPAS